MSDLLNAPHRRRILLDYKKLRDDLAQMFIDVASWNENARKPDEAPIDPDPFGEMRALMTAIDELLQADQGHGTIAPLNYARHH